uniref:AIG1-type G domain-containing protein n=1 Tax=Aplanochytrium stocchinoi TaxID=215587 RepID=A0A7S3PR03_9STRA|mmetsp:Transcript_1684/g.2535  ORF Transcript_1684/g.2535 Transcript_1684/m.2535 type:complete len:319 (+) Transcript_1684:279-1235(+)
MNRIFTRAIPNFHKIRISSPYTGAYTKALFAGSLSLTLGGVALCFRRENELEQNEDAVPKRLLKEEKLGAWEGTGYTVGKLNRGDLHDVENHRHVIALLGVTGSGKSSTANTLMSGSHKRYFDVADSLTSVTRSTCFRDYEFQGIPFRIIDTPGFGDTNRSKEDVEKEIRDFAKFAKHGVSCFFVILPKGRVTEESEKVLLRAKELFGDDFAKHAVVVFTHGLGSDTVGMRRQLLTRDILIEEINKLENRHFLRELVGQVDLRVMAIENKLEPYRRISKFQLHQAVLDVEKSNGNNRYLGIQATEEPKDQNQAARGNF